jgi:hypothetical protein
MRRSDGWGGEWKMALGIAREGWVVRIIDVRVEWVLMGIDMNKNMDRKCSA